MEHTGTPDPIIVRLKEGLDKIALVLRMETWAAATDAGLNPSQAQVLSLLAARPAGLRPKEIALHVGVSAASTADTLSALARKGLLLREPDPSDARAVTVRATAEGLRIGNAVSRAANRVTSALGTLAPDAQENLLRTQIELIRQLQLAGAIPAQRMCVSCRHFRPLVHPGQAAPHHCDFVNAPIGGRDLRLDCGEHEEANPVAQAATWATFTKGPPSLQA